MSSPALKKRKKTPKSASSSVAQSPAPQQASLPKAAPPLSALAARRAAAQAAAVPDVPEPIAPTPPSPTISSASSAARSPSLSDSSELPEDLRPPTPAVTSTKKSSRRKANKKSSGKDKENLGQSRYWDESLPPMETGPSRVSFLDSNGQGNWRPDEIVGDGKGAEMGEFEMFGEELDSDDGFEGGNESFLSEQREVVRESRGDGARRDGYEQSWQGRSETGQQQQHQERPSPRNQGRRREKT